MGEGKVQQAVRGLLAAGVPLVWLGDLRWESFGPPTWSTTRRENTVRVRDLEIPQAAFLEPLRLLILRSREGGCTPDPHHLILPRDPLLVDLPTPIEWLQVLSGDRDVEDEYLTRALHLGRWLYIAGHAAQSEADRWAYYYLDHLAQTQDREPFYTVGCPAAEVFLQGAVFAPSPSPHILDDLLGAYYRAPVRVQRAATWDRVEASWRALWGNGVTPANFWAHYNAWWGTSAEALLTESYQLLGLPLPSTPRGRVGTVDADAVANIVNLAQVRAEREIDALVKDPPAGSPEPPPKLEDADLDTPVALEPRVRTPKPRAPVPEVDDDSDILQGSALPAPPPSPPVKRIQQRRLSERARGEQIARALAEFGEGFGKLAEALTAPMPGPTASTPAIPSEIMGHVLRVWGVFRLSEAVLARHARVRKPLGRSLPVSERRAQARGRLDAQWKPNVPYYAVTLGNTRPLMLTEEQWESLEAVRAWSAGRIRDEAERKAFPLLPRVVGSPELGVWSLVELQQAARNYHRTLPKERRVPDYDDGLDLPELPTPGVAP